MVKQRMIPPSQKESRTLDLVWSLEAVPVRLARRADRSKRAREVAQSGRRKGMQNESGKGDLYYYNISLILGWWIC